MKHIRTTMNYGQHPKDHEINVGPSKTIPDQAYTVKEIMARHQLGQLTDIQRQGMYDEDVTFDSEDMRQAAQADLIDVQQKINTAKETIKKAKDQKDAEFKKASESAYNQKIVKAAKKLQSENAVKAQSLKADLDKNKIKDDSNS